MFLPYEVRRLSQELESKSPQEIIAWAVETFWPAIVLSSSFQTQSVPLLYMATRIKPDLPIFFLDTGYHFWETLMFREELAHKWNLNVIDLRRDARWDTFARQNVRSLPLEDPNLCCYIHKVLPMQTAMHQKLAWISGIRRDQTSERAGAQILEIQKDGLLKVNPLLNWTRWDVQAYMKEHDLPAHPLFEKGFRSVGCAPCTLAVGVNDDERAGRWVGRGKTECGLHTTLFEKNLGEAQPEFILHPALNGTSK
ncbi:MAG: phosphoadenylyl-sulfate reductase [Chloroflexi bacterium]|nr:phosphoadenylyl-sulfate reductase [Chloroflexota bacterium]